MIGARATTWGTHVVYVRVEDRHGWGVDLQLPCLEPSTYMNEY
jgi:hypothetical protein